MIKKVCLFCWCLLAFSAHAQTTPKVIGEEPFGKVSMDELTMTDCDFEKNANAEVIFSKAVIKANPVPETDIHQRIKIFTDRGTHRGEFSITLSRDNFGNPISDIQVETFNLENGKIVPSVMDKKAVYLTNVDKWTRKISFVAPDVKPGSVIDVKYSLRYVILNWYFQDLIPTRYSELETDYLGRANYKTIPHVRQSFASDNHQDNDGLQIRIMTNVHSLPDEPYMTSQKDNLQRVEILNADLLGHSWDRIAEVLLRFENFGTEMDQSLADQGNIVKRAKKLATIDEKVSFIFDTVKNAMKWDNTISFFTTGPIRSAWNKKSGNSADLNLILYNLLKSSGVNAFPMLISTRKNGKLSPAAPNPLAFNDVVVYVPVDTSRMFILDATNKYALYNTIPFDNLNTFGVSLDPVAAKARLIPIEYLAPVIQSVYVNAEITPDGKLNGTAEITSDQYNKIEAAQMYHNAPDQSKYLDSLRNGDNSIKITAFKIDNMNVDSLPLIRKVDFSINLPGADENYITFNTNLFSQVRDNPFKDEARYSDIDFGYRADYSITGTFKIPAGYKVDALPKSMTIIMPDQSILFKRTVAQENDVIQVRYLIDHRKTVTFLEDYQDLRGFYKKMYELLNEQVVLKKG